MVDNRLPSLGAKTMLGIIVVERKNDFELMVKFKYIKSNFTEMKDDFKDSISQREYDPENKAWLVPNSCLDEVKDWCEQAKGVWVSNVEYRLDAVNDSKKDENTNKTKDWTVNDKFNDFDNLIISPKLASYYSTLYLTPNAPQELITFVWKKLAQMYHPDKNGGDGSKMTAINAAYQEIEKERK